MMTLLEWRTAKNMTQSQLAEALNISQPAIHKYETGSAPMPKIMQSIIEYTGGKVQPQSFYCMPARRGK